MVHFSTQSEFNNFIQRVGALQSQIGYAWTKAREEGADNEALLYSQYQYLRYAIRALCPVVVGATDNLLTDDEVDYAYERIKVLGNLCDNHSLLLDTL